jgi:hypothetical protein
MKKNPAQGCSSPVVSWYCRRIRAAGRARQDGLHRSTPCTPSPLPTLLCKEELYPYMAQDQGLYITRGHQAVPVAGRKEDATGGDGRGNTLGIISCPALLGFCSCKAATGVRERLRHQSTRNGRDKASTQGRRPTPLAHHSHRHGRALKQGGFHATRPAACKPVPVSRTTDMISVVAVAVVVVVVEALLLKDVGQAVLYNWRVEN